ncbi:MAG: glycine--tRNA ligase subunit alpha [Candidatus Coatesbacteria bacterium]|nr:MAG: glycine--tRNA ligase subunit alpha [Candidatus Coatesbacteria bacterium]
MNTTPLSLQELVAAFNAYWAERGCLLVQPADVESGAGTFHAATFLRALGPEPWRAAFVAAARRPRDGRYGENPHRLYLHYQYQVILKPAPADVMDQYVGSLEALGVDPAQHDLRYDEDDWESPTLGAWGLGWQVLLDGMEITQFTYFQQMGGYDCDPVTVELTYGLERIAAFLAGVDSLYDVAWGGGMSYGDVRREEEREHSIYALEAADVDLLFRLYEAYEAEGRRLADAGLVYPAHDYLLKSSHAFNLLDARGALGVTERANYIGRLRGLARAVAGAWLARGEGGEAEADAA